MKRARAGGGGGGGGGGGEAKRLHPRLLFPTAPPVRVLVLD